MAIINQITRKNQFQYYWFVSTLPMTQKTWNCDIAIGIRELRSDASNLFQNDVNLYVSVMDGRYPTETDYDYKSEMIGTDFVRISNSDYIFNSGGWNP